MGKVCITIKKGLDADMGTSSTFLDSLSANGYSFDKVHKLSSLDVKNLTKLLDTYQNEGAFVVVLMENDVKESSNGTFICGDKTQLVDTVCALNEESIEKRLVQLLKQKNLKISVAESFTGGGIAKKITSVSGASEVYFEGINCYNETSKIKRLGVLEKTLQEKGAVSKETALEMAYGLLNTGDCDVAIATTGLAGPNSDSSGKPVGLCYLSIGIKDDVKVYEHIFTGTRQEITEKAIDCALNYAYKHIIDL